MRSSFERESDIDMASTTNLPYMQAYFDEALHFYPPAPLGLLRVVPKGGATIAGRGVPRNVSRPSRATVEMHC